ncbi:hypothetical protein ACFQI7_30690 [Paenibacillus allorhizosphaerae]|uniref:Uncharacterized protein n=1 Tax=Paenibacillus allorhizosphaerae TaxID=2849866 RepID=A0ABM8VPS4_9BACL|nr:hypothetical protein [Paenibacillus allorhizosphaerae]CAG7653270.1 hypothetical protein PAECIP111802_05445 [Paenibacillus allorhizosphaerae]
MTMLKDSEHIATIRSLHAEIWERLQHCEEQEAEAFLRRSLSEISGEAPFRTLRSFPDTLRELLTIRGVVFAVLAGVSFAALFAVFFVYAALWIE